MQTLDSPVERQLGEAAQRLLDEFGRAFDRKTIEEEVERAFHRSDAARVRVFSAIFAYRFAREALRARLRRESEPAARGRDAG